MTALTCPGPGPVDLPTLGIYADEGETVDVPDEFAASLIEQGWKAVKAAPTKPAKGSTKEGDD